MIFHENRLSADDSHEISYLICYFWKSSKIWNCCLLQNVGGTLRVKKVWWKEGGGKLILGYFENKKKMYDPAIRDKYLKCIPSI